jgi:hypothetical protein
MINRMFQKCVSFNINALVFEASDHSIYCSPDIFISEGLQQRSLKAAIDNRHRQLLPVTNVRCIALEHP